MDIRFCRGRVFWLEPLLNTSQYDPTRDFSPISLIEESPNLFVVHPSAPVNSVKDLFALAKSNPAQPNYASSVVGSSPHLAVDHFKSMADINIVRISYKEGGRALNRIVGGEAIYFSRVRLQ